MLFYSRENMIISTNDMIKMDLCDDLGYMYATLGTLTQAILLADRYKGEPDILNKVLALPYDQEVVDELKVLLPKPLNMLAPFFNLVNDEELYLTMDNIEETLGVLCMMSRYLNFFKIASVNPAIRSEATFGKSVLLDYSSNFRNMKKELGLFSMQAAESVDPVVQMYQPYNTLQSNTAVSPTIEYKQSPLEQSKEELEVRKQVTWNKEEEIGSDEILVEDDGEALSKLLFGDFDFEMGSKIVEPLKEDKPEEKPVEDKQKYVTDIYDIATKFATRKTREEYKEVEQVIADKKDEVIEYTNVKLEEQVLSEDKDAVDDGSALIEEDPEVVQSNIVNISKKTKQATIDESIKDRFSHIEEPVSTMKVDEEEQYEDEDAGYDDIIMEQLLMFGE